MAVGCHQQLGGVVRSPRTDEVSSSRFSLLWRAAFNLSWAPEGLKVVQSVPPVYTAMCLTEVHLSLGNTHLT